MKQSTLFPLILVIIIAAAVLLFVRQPAQAPQGTETPHLSTSASPSPSGTVLPTSQQGIIINTPRVNASVSNPITVTGKAQTFEGAFSYALRDAAGKVWFQGHGQAGTPDEVTYYRDFSVKIPVPAGAPRDLIIEVFEYSAKDGSIINLVKVPVKLATADTTTVQVYLHNRRLNANDSCDVVFPVARTVIKTQEPAFISLNELLRGPIDADKDEQYYTSIPDGVKLNSLRITSGTAYADFNNALEYQVGGSCRVLAIRTQITNTLKQFSSVKNVVISIDGRTDDILQP